MKILDLALSADGKRIVIAAEIDGEDVLAEHFSDMPEGEFHEIPVTIIRTKTDSKDTGNSG